MAEISIPCEAIARLSKVLQFFPNTASEWANTIRIDGNVLMVTNQCYMVVEKFDWMVEKPVHIKADERLIKACENETMLNGHLFLTIDYMLGVVTAKTSYGYTHPESLLFTHASDNELDRWRDVVPTDLATVSRGGMLLDLTGFLMFAETSPSRRIVFETHIDITRPTIIRDLFDDGWFGVFNPKDFTIPHDAAKLPGWFNK